MEEGAPLDRSDFHVREFGHILRRLQPHLPISDAYERDLPQLRGRWWSSQREHMRSWFGAQDGYGFGAYSRATPNTSARIAYNRLLATAAILWIAEALGESREVLEAASEAARAEPDVRRRAGIVRARLPWARIAELARKA